MSIFLNSLYPQDLYNIGKKNCLESCNNFNYSIKEGNMQPDWLAIMLFVLYRYKILESDVLWEIITILNM